MSQMLSSCWGHFLTVALHLPVFLSLKDIEYSRCRGHLRQPRFLFLLHLVHSMQYTDLFVYLFVLALDHCYVPEIHFSALFDYSLGFLLLHVLSSQYVYLTHRSFSTFVPLCAFLTLMECFIISY